jgi:hypothetical protein
MVEGAVKGRTQVYAVVRHNPGYTQQPFTVKEIVSSLEIAKSEVDRLNALDGPIGAVYSWQATRLYPAGTSAGSSEGIG